MDKLIREQDVLDVINEAIRIGRFYCGKEQTIAEIKAIPAAESDTGHWIEMPIGFKCSKCNSLEDKTTKFCPNCGAKLFSASE